MESVTNYELMQKLKDIEHKVNNLNSEFCDFIKSDFIKSEENAKRTDNVKILLFKTHGGNTVDKELKERLSINSFPLNRVGTIVDYIEQQGKLVAKYPQGSYYQFKTGETYYIQEVDINRPWTISEYDGSEYIQYLDYEVTEESIGYCRFKG